MHEIPPSQTSPRLLAAHHCRLRRVLRLDVNRGANATRTTAMAVAVSRMLGAHMSKTDDTRRTRSPELRLVLHEALRSPAM